MNKKLTIALWQQVFCAPALGRELIGSLGGHVWIRCSCYVPWPVVWM